MYIIQTIQVNGFDVQIIKMPLDEIQRNQEKFNGQKILHPFETEKNEKIEIVQPKNGKSYEKKSIVMNYSDKFTSPEAQEAITNPLHIDVKFDGSCGFLQYQVVSDELCVTAYTRRDVGFDEKTNDLKIFGKKYKKYEDISSMIIQCEEDPRNGTKYANYSKLHWPFWVPYAKYYKGKIETISAISGVSPNEYKFNMIAFTRAVESGHIDKLTHSMTVEQMGDGFNIKESDIFTGSGIVPHGSLQIKIPTELLTPSGLKDIVRELPFFEGMVIYGNNGTIWKFRRECITGLKWPENDCEKTDWTYRCALI
jgi:hypothetical protein